MDLEALVLELYGLAQKTSPRHATTWSRQRRSEGCLRQRRGEGSCKPMLAAWLANQLVRAEPDRVNELTELGDEFRAAHLGWRC
jgi:hypothetical protein